VIAVHQYTFSVDEDYQVQLKFDDYHHCTRLLLFELPDNFSFTGVHYGV
jgi:hypothetical protein